MQAPLISLSAMFSVTEDRPNVAKAASSATSMQAMATRRKMTSIAKNQRADRGVSPSIDGRPGDLHDGLAAAWTADHARSELGKDPRP